MTASGALAGTGTGSWGTGNCGTDIGTAGDVSASERDNRGAMIAFSTLAEPQIGHATRPRLACLS